MEEEKKEYTDTKKIERKALNYLHDFIEDGERVSPYLADNDKEPSWDGHLYLYSEKRHDKEHLIGRVPVQVKGTEVERFQTKKWKFKLEKSDLKAYLHEPTFFIVCQIKKNSKERKLFYRELLPDTVRTLLKDMGANETRKTIFHPLTEDLKEFEDQLLVFMRNSKKMVSFADSKPLTYDDVIKKGIKDFSFVVPVQPSERIKLLKYLSTHGTYLYAKISKEFDVEIPVSGGPARFAFKREMTGEVKVGDRVFFNGYCNEIKNGRIIITVGDILTLNLPMDAEDKVKAIVKLDSKANLLDEAIQEAEFAIALNEKGILTIGDLDINLKVNETGRIEWLKEKVAAWKELKHVLDKLHVTKQLDLTSITKEQERLIDILIQTVGEGGTVNLPKQTSTLFLFEISNIKLLLWCAANNDGQCTFGDYFDNTIRISYKYNEKDLVFVSPFSYLQNDNLWSKIDNIDYQGLIPSAMEATKDSSYNYEMLNYDVLSMINGSDSLQQNDASKCEVLLQKASELNSWLIENDPQKERRTIHICNKYQIIKRNRGLSDSECEKLRELLKDTTIHDTVKSGIYLLLDEQPQFEAIWNSLPEEEKSRMRKFPIMKFNRERV